MVFILKYWRWLIFGALVVVIGIQWGVIKYKDNRIKSLEQDLEVAKAQLVEKDRKIEELLSLIERQNKAIQKLKEEGEKLKKKIQSSEEKLVQLAKMYKELESRVMEKSESTTVYVEGERKDISKWVQDRWNEILYGR